MILSLTADRSTPEPERHLLLMQVYMAGMGEPFLKAGLVMDKVMATSVG